MESQLKLRMQTPKELANELQELLQQNEIVAEEVADEGGMKDVTAFFNVAVQMTSFVALGLQLYEFVRRKKQQTGHSQAIKIETPGAAEQPFELIIEPGKPKPVIKIQLEKLQQNLEQKQ